MATATMASWAVGPVRAQRHAASASSFLQAPAKSMYCVRPSSRGAVAARSSVASAAVAAEATATPTVKPAGVVTKASETFDQLKAYGLAGVVAYGLFNTVYYMAAFTFFWVAVAKVPTGLGLEATAFKFLETFAMVWAGSQVTKVARAAGALLLAPVMDSALSALQSKWKLQSKLGAFYAIAGFCLTAAAALFTLIVLLWA